MTRATLPATRWQITAELTHQVPGREPVRLAASYGGAPGDLRIREVFCRPFKTGTDLQDLLHQACIALSLVLQHGATVEQLAHALGEDDASAPPRSILGLIVREACALQPELQIAGVTS